MSRTNGACVAPRNQKAQPVLVPEQKQRDGLLLTAWQRIVGGFKSRPFPRAAWDEAFRADFPYMAFKPVVTPIRAALLAAVADGDTQLIEQTLEGARAFCRELEADFVSLVPPGSDASIVSLALVETHDEGPTNEVQMALVQNPTPAEAERAIGPLSRHCAALVLLLDRCRRVAREPSPRTVALFRSAR